MKWTLIVLSVLLFSCQNKSTENVVSSKTESAVLNLDIDLAKKLFDLPTHCLTQEYPNKLGQVLGSDADLKSPRALRPLFYGCFDWHSSVHGYWSIVKLLTLYPELDASNEVREMLSKHITTEKVQVEIDFFNDVNNTSFERTYGWAWLLMLQQELEMSKDPQFKTWADTLKPLSNLIVERYKVYLPKLVYPIRTGQHDNTAFSLSLALDYAVAVGDTAFEKLLTSQAKRLFKGDVNCNLSYEPSGYDFLSPCLEEALLFSKILTVSEYRIWLKGFLPEVLDSKFFLTPARVSDRTDGKLVHLDGLNFSRANCLNTMAKKLPELTHLRVMAKKHFEYSVDNLANDDYMGSHWLGTFALYTISKY